ncbi:hypothetical protein MUK42_11933 [Musa troglodytarum]|uniref:Uncharacterized protein n=1 Tax=Musa troglodytarum TaxID=320322 RepID=A0A9E7H0M4_9LILI|nr:hypothetical protein MUK42_11933 [Musa troglodytarum]
MDVNPWSLAKVCTTVGDLVSAWDYQETIEDLNRKILCSDMELERLRINAHHELQKAKETIEQLVEQLQVRTSERDEARKQVQLLLHRFMQPDTAQLPLVLQHPPPATSQMLHGRASSYHAETDNMSTEAASSSTIRKYDRASAVTDILAMKKALPERGKFQQAVLRAGPLLQTVMSAGPPALRHPQVPSAAINAVHLRERRDEAKVESMSKPDKISRWNVRERERERERERRI